MAELEWVRAPERPGLRRAVRHQLRSFDPALRIVAEDFMADTTAVDLLGVGAEGELVALRIGREGADAALMTQALSDVTWLRARVGDWLQLAPSLELDPNAPPRALLLCPGFGPETRGAVEALSPSMIQLIRYQAYRHRGQLGVLLENGNPRVSSSRTAVFGSPNEGSRLRSESAGPHERAFPDARIVQAAAEIDYEVEKAEPLPAPPSPSTFRTGLTDEDLRSGEDELSEFERGLGSNSR